MKLKEKLAQIHRSLPYRSELGQLHANPTETQGKWKKVTLYTLFESSEETHLLRPHVFETKTARPAAEWHSWFRENVDAIIKRDIIPGINLRTGKIWRVKHVIGWQRVISKSRNTKPPARKHKTKQKGRAHG